MRRLGVVFNLKSIVNLDEFDWKDISAQKIAGELEANANMKNITVLSHHQYGGGQPLDSLWFSSPECERYGLQLNFLWTKAKTSLWRFVTSRKIIFDGAQSLVNHRGYRFYALSQLLGMQTAIYWHETEWGVERAINKQPHSYPVIHKVLTNPKLVHFHVCNYGLKMLHESYGVNSKNLYLLNNISEESGLLRYQLPIPSESGFFVACGAAVEKKGVDLFLDIADKVISRGVEAKFVWVGSFKSGAFSQENIAKEVERRRIKENVFFTGQMSNPTEFIAKASVFLLTSRDDPMPKVLMEALALGKPCVAFGVGGVPELLDHFGTIIPPGNTEAFTEALIRKHHEKEDESEQHRRREWYLQRYTTATFGSRFAEAVQWWDKK
ncbi:MAG: hypothetical protein BRC47_07270 [Cyanobacteria bacterium QS_7_48_42]|nr:MAG: hypothetical protein BRC47_07270 [Cyanobacteria bacterium QS_7_48_42]